MAYDCSTCGYATVYRTKEVGHPDGIKKIECQCGKEVRREYTCDRWIKGAIGWDTLGRCIDKSLRRMESYKNGTYEIHRNPVQFMTNYRKVNK